jgi:hypothetical protein
MYLKKKLIWTVQLKLYSYLEALSVEGTSDSIEQLSHYLEICDLFWISFT